MARAVLAAVVLAVLLSSPSQAQLALDTQLNEDLQMYAGSQMHMLQLEAAGSMGFSWVEHMDEPPVTLQLVHLTGGDLSVAASVPATYRSVANPAKAKYDVADGKVAEAIVTGLQDGHTYNINVLHDILGVSTPVSMGSFTYVGPNRGQNNLTIAVVGDLGLTYTAAFTVAALNAHARKGHFDAFILPGDISYANGATRDWDKFMQALSPLLSRIPMNTCPGNHEGVDYVAHEDEEMTAYRLRFPVGANGAFSSPSPFYYSYDMGGVHFVALCTEHLSDEFMQGQATWLRSDLELAANKRGANPSEHMFIVVFEHRAMYTSALVETGVSTPTHGPDLAFRDLMEPIFLEHGVDLVLCGHDHIYERSHPSAAGEHNEDTGIVHLQIGTGGHNVHRSFDVARKTTAFRKVTTGYGVLTIYPDTMSMRFEQWEMNTAGVANTQDAPTIFMQQNPDYLEESVIDAIDVFSRVYYEGRYSTDGTVPALKRPLPAPAAAAVASSTTTAALTAASSTTTTAALTAASSTTTSSAPTTMTTTAADAADITTTTAAPPPPPPRTTTTTRATTVARTTTTTAAPEKKGGGESDRAKGSTGGVVFGTLLLLAIVCTGVFLILRKVRQQRRVSHVRAMYSTPGGDQERERLWEFGDDDDDDDEDEDVIFDQSNA